MSWWRFTGISLLCASCARPDPSSGTTSPSASASLRREPPPAAVAMKQGAPDAEFVLTPLRSGLSVARGLLAAPSGVQHEWRVVRVDLKRFHLRVRAIGSRDLAELSGAPELLLAVNAGFFDHDFSASGLLISEGTTLAKTRRGGGSGILSVQGTRAELLSRNDPLPPGLDFAVQCGPRLIERDASVGIQRDDGKRAARTVACIRDRGDVLDLLVVFTPELRGDGPTLFELARRLSTPLVTGDTFGCEAALNLDGGPSTGMIVPEAPRLRWDPAGPVPFALTVQRRVPGR